MGKRILSSILCGIQIFMIEVYSAVDFSIKHKVLYSKTYIVSSTV